MYFTKLFSLLILIVKISLFALYELLVFGGWTLKKAKLLLITKAK